MSAELKQARALEEPAADREEGGRWKPGSSPNPGGQTKRDRNLRREVRDLAGRYSPEAVRMLARIMRNSKVAHATRVAAASAILDRAVGKPAVPQSALLDDGTTAPFEPLVLGDIELARRVAFMLQLALHRKRELEATPPAIEAPPAPTPESAEATE